MDCLFCKIANKELPADVVYEDDSVTAVLDINPISPGHAMILPKFHAETVLDLPDELLGPVFEAVKKVTAKLRETLSPDAFTIGINHGRAAGQAVKHLHVHVVPRWENDGGTNIHGVVKNPPGKEQLEEIKKQLTTNSK